MPPLPSPSLLHQILVKMEEEALNKRNKVAILSDHVLFLILSCFTTRSLCSYKCVVTLGMASSWDPSTIRSCPRFSPDSSTAAGNANTTSLVLMVNTPPFPSCHSPFRMSWSQITPGASSSSGNLGFAMLSAIRWLRNGCYCHVATILMVQLAWGLIRQSPHTSMYLNMGSVMMTP
jgi:hypothetical protein